MVSVDWTPSKPFLDDPLTVRVTELEAGQTLRLCTRLRGPEDMVYESVISTSADKEGTATVTTDPTELDFLTQMKPIDEQEKTPESFPDLLLIGKTREGEQLFCEMIERRTCRPEITVEEVSGDGFVGKLYRAKDNSPRPGIVFLGGSSGGFPPAYRIELLASHGYTVLGTAYFGIYDLPETLTEIPVEHVENAITTLQSHQTTTDEIGIVGGSRGAELALLLAARNSIVNCVVGYVPSGIVWESAGEQSAWSIDGRPHPYLSGDFRDIDNQDDPVEFDEGHRITLASADEEDIEAASIPIEESTAAILLISGDDDRLWPSADLATRVMRRLENTGYNHEYKHICYSNAGHQIKIPFLPAYNRSSGGELPDGRKMAYGGTPDGYIEADYDSWQRTLSFLDRHLG